jgi:hypothetical protein
MPEKLKPAKLERLISMGGALALPLAAFLATSPRPMFTWLVASFVVIVGLLELASFHVYRGADRVWWVIARSSAFYLAWFLMLMLIPSPALRSGYLALSVPVLYIGQRLIELASETVILVHTALVSWALLSAAVAAEYYFRVGGSILTLSVFGALLVISRATFAAVPRPATMRWLSALAVALFATEGYLAVLFLPFSYLATGFIAFMWFYLVWLFTYHWQCGMLHARKVQFYILFAIALVLMVLLATPWRTIT